MNDDQPQPFFKNQMSAAPTQKLLLMIHGYTGDENSMWVFSRAVQFPIHILAPRALYPANEGGFTWVKDKTTYQSSLIEDFIPSAQTLMNSLKHWIAEYTPDVTELYIIGFSQGAAMAYVLGLLFPDQFTKIACLSGYFPEPAEQFIRTHPSTSAKFFVAHGKNDPIVPVQTGQNAAALLKKSLIPVIYAEDDSGHKLGPENFQALKRFFADPIYPVQG